MTLSKDERTLRMPVLNCEWVSKRHRWCEFAIIDELERARCKIPTIICVPKLESWEQVCELNNKIEELRVLHILDDNRALLKIPYYVKNIRAYTIRLFREHLKSQ